MLVKNIFKDFPPSLQDELIEEMISSSSFRLERIISEGHSSPDGFWYDQDKDEFVLLLSGSAVISFEDEPDIQLAAGDYLIIPAHKKHRVEKTDSVEKTIWLALHF